MHDWSCTNCFAKVTGLLHDTCNLQAPFCVHPKTGKVCVPIDPAAAWDFDPETVPTVQQLVKELADQQQAAGTDAPSKVRTTQICWGALHLVHSPSLLWCLRLHLAASNFFMAR